MTYVCQKRGTPGQGVIFAIGFEIVDEELKKALGNKGVEVSKSSRGLEMDEEKEQEEEGISDDID